MSLNYGEDESLLGKSESNNVSNKNWKRWSIVGAGSALIATVVIIVGITSSNSSRDVVKPQVQKSVFKGSSSRMKYNDLSEEEKKNLFTRFQSDHGRKYDTVSEESLRFENFKASLSLIDARNLEEESKGGTAKHGVTKFADWSESEIKSRLLTSKPPKGFKREGHSMKKVPKYSGSSTSVDWSGVYTTAVKDQGYCGSCWAFSATEQIESDAIRAGQTTVALTLSPQQIVSCDTGDYGCDGGWTEMAYQYVARAGGITSDASYPYTSYFDVTGTCNAAEMTTKIVTVDAYYGLDSEDEMKEYVLSTGPLSVCLDASTWATYTSGIVSSCGFDVDHCVQAVGVDTEKLYWKVRNSWGTDWGDEGYIYLKYGENTCDIAYDPTYVSTSLVSSSAKSSPKKGSKETNSKSHSATSK